MPYYVSNAAPIVNISWASTITIDLSAAPGNNGLHRCTLGGATTVNISGGIDGQKAIIELKQDGTGSRTVSLSASFGFGTDITSYTATTTAGSTDLIGVIYNATAGKYRVIALAKGY